MNHNEPTMQAWSDAWHDKDEVRIKNCYAENAIVMHPKQQLVQGKENIINFFRAGIGKHDVKFFAVDQRLNGLTCLEFGNVIDFERNTDTQVFSGSYIVTWSVTKEGWKITSHAWNSP